MYPREARERALRTLAESASFAEAARAAGVSRTTLARWAWAAGVDPSRGKREAVHLPFERKLELVRRLEAGERAGDLAREAGVSAGAVYSWRKRLLCGGEAALVTRREAASGAAGLPEMPEGDEALRRRNRELELRVAVLEGTIEILKKGGGADPAALTRAEASALARSLRGSFPLAEVLEALSLPRSTFYHHAAAAARPDRDAELRPLVRESFEASGGAYGSERVWADIRARGHVFSEKRVRRVMREEGLVARSTARAPHRYSSYRGEEGLRTAPNLLLVGGSGDRHDFSAPRPGERLVTDVTEFPCDGFKAYLSPVVDLYDGRVVSWAASTSPSKALVAEMLEGLAGSARPGCLLHSDRGWHYRTPDWVAACERMGVERSMSRLGHSPDNAACEAFFGRLKVEFFYGRDWSGVGPDEFIGELDAYIGWYNSGRLKRFTEGGAAVWDTIDGRRARLGLAA